MSRPYHGMSAAAVPAARWQKASASNSQGNCVEVAPLPGGQIAVRNSRHPLGPVLIYTRSELAAFLHGAKSGEFDHLTS